MALDAVAFRVPDFEINPVLFGFDPFPRLLAVEPDGDESVILYHRDDEGAVCSKRDRLIPFLWLQEPVSFPDVEILPLAGEAPFRFLAQCRSWPQFLELRGHLYQQRIPFFAFTDPVQQYLTRTGRTLFKELEFEKLHRLQIAITTRSDPADNRSDPKRKSDHLLTIALTDSAGLEHLIECTADSEKAALVELNALIAEINPDVIEGHMLCNHILPFLTARAARHKTPLIWGRDSSRMRSRSSRIQIAEKTIDFTRFDIHGRHVVDTFLLAQLYDVGSRELESFELKDIAEHFSIEPASSDNDTLQAAKTTRSLSSALSPSHFMQTRMFPFGYQNVIVRGNATRIDALFLREYLRRGHSIPDLPVPQRFEGGYTDIFYQGVVRNVWHCDVASLYPSVMLAYGLFPTSDALHVFEGLLSDLRRFRLETKLALQNTAPERSSMRSNLQALQSAFKILINSFYGYLGFAQGHFADFEAAAAVTRTGRELLRQMVQWLRDAGAEVIEIDTDGIFFVPPADADPAALETAMNATLPDGIRVEFDARYEAMFSYKAKNYALLTTDNHVLMTGAALKSRGLELFQRQFLERMIRHLLEGEPEHIAALENEFSEAITNRTWPVQMFMKTDTLQDSPTNYARKIAASSRNRAAAYELAAKSARTFRSGDQVSYYVTGEKKNVAVYDNSKLVEDWDPANRDENTAYYLAKLADLRKKFAAFFPQS